MSICRVGIFILCAFCWSAFAETPNPVTALTFHAWKEKQVLEAQNQTLRISTHITQLRAGPSDTAPEQETQTEKLHGLRVKKSSNLDTLASAERDLKRAQEGVEAANSLQLEDYITIYLPSLQDQPASLAKLTEQLSKDELAEVLNSLLKRNAKLRNSSRYVDSSLGGLGSSVGPKEP